MKSGHNCWIYIWIRTLLRWQFTSPASTTGETTTRVRKWRRRRAATPRTTSPALLASPASPALISTAAEPPKICCLFSRSWVAELIQTVTYIFSGGSGACWRSGCNRWCHHGVWWSKVSHWDPGSSPQSGGWKPCTMKWLKIELLH